MKLIIMRHGQASWEAASDELRPLTEHGRAEVAATAVHMKDEVTPNRIIASPYLRAQQTAQIMAEHFGCPVETLDELVPEGEPSAVARALQESEETIMLVSHMPLVAYLSGWFCDGSRHSISGFQTAEARLIDLEFVAQGFGVVTHAYLP